jgi:hypothetical protein
MLVAAALLGRYCLSINDNLPSSRRGSQSGRFQSRADRDALRNGGTGSASDEATQSGDRHGPDGGDEPRAPGHWEARADGADPGAGEGVAVAPGKRFR